MTNKKVQGDKATLLVVEDYLPMLEEMRRILEEAGYYVQTAINGQAGLQAFCECQPNLIVADIVMPVMDGFEFLEAVRKHPGGRKIPVIFVTALSEQENILAAKALGVDDYLIKPIHPEELVSAVKTRLQRFEEVTE